MLDKKYDHLKVENDKYDYWLDQKAFVSGNEKKQPFTIVIPPPNVTGKLHIGHAWDTTLQDFLIRYKKLQGFDALWVPGMDHAGIATQAVVEKRLREQDGVLRHDLGREKFIKKAWEWKEEFASTIRAQWAKLGLSLDYSKECFTLDEGLSKLVEDNFINLYNKKLIYRGKRIINWDPVQQTALSNIEVIKEERNAKMYHFKYFSKDKSFYLEVATTRPETMFGDVVLAVNPEDDRYKKYLGQEFINPVNGDLLPLISDEHVELDFGTGVMKVTPAHDFYDFDIGKRNNLEQIIIMNKDGTMNELCKGYEGLDRFEARKLIVKNTTKDGTLKEVKDHKLILGISERSKAVVEPYLSDQWFVCMKNFAKEVIKLQNSKDKIEFFAPRFNDELIRWMDKLEDWCISRQLWWGHRIPAWFKDEEIKVQAECPGAGWIQDEDVLDTWFSSQLWPYAATGYKRDDKLFKRHFPNDVLVTGYDIIFFWVARMITSSIFEFKERPFKKVLIHGLIRAEDGQKMSKSLGNGVDPMDVIEQYGCDSLRYFLLTNTSPGNDLRFSNEKILASKNFINKIYNASNFVALQEVGDVSNLDISKLNLDNKDKWIIKKFNDTLSKVTDNIEKYEFSMAFKHAYNFIWDDYCNWYIEFSKHNTNKDGHKLLKYLLKQILIMMHPIIPFVTEHIYLDMFKDQKSIMFETWPETIKAPTSKTIKSTIEVILKIRELRAKLQVGKKFPIDVLLQDKLFKNCEPQLIIGMEKVKVINDNTITEPYQFNYEANDDKNDEIIEKEIEKIEQEIKRAKGILSNNKFLEKAPKQKIEQEQEKLKMWEEKLKAFK